jgi:hypothetical protein
MVIPNSTKTSEMLIVDVILAFKNRIADIFFLPVIRVADNKSQKEQVTQIA